MDQCPDCSFIFGAIAKDEIAVEATKGVAAIVSLLEANPEVVTKRPSDDRWSTLEYAAHVRDVLLTIRDRMVLGLVEDNPTFKPLYRDERIDLDLYRFDQAEPVAAELQAASAMFIRLLNAIDTDSLDRPVQYGFPGPTTRTVSWMSEQAVHEIGHHLADMEQNHTFLGPTSGT